MISFLKRLAATVVTPGTGMVTVFVESSTGEPSYKDDAGAVASLKGPPGGTPGGVSGDMQVNTAGAFAAASGVTWASNQLLITAQAAGTTPLAVKAATSQTANLTDWVNSVGTSLTSIRADGDIAYAPTTARHVKHYYNASFGVAMSMWSGGTFLFGLTSNVAVLPETFSLEWRTGPTSVFIRGSIALGASNTQMNFATNGSSTVRMDTSTTASETRLLVWDVDAGSLRRVSVGAADSGGTGFKTLRVPN